MDLAAPPPPNPSICRIKILDLQNKKFWTGPWLGSYAILSLRASLRAQDSLFLVGPLKIQGPRRIASNLSDYKQDNKDLQVSPWLGAAQSNGPTRQ